MSLGFWALYARRHFRWTRLEATQLVLGLSIPFLLADHFIGTRVALSQFGLEKGYAQELLKFWVHSPFSGALQAILSPDRLDSRLSRPAFLAAAQAILSARERASSGRSPCSCRRSRCSAITRAASARCKRLRTQCGERAIRPPSTSAPRLRTRLCSTSARGSSPSWARRWPSTFFARGVRRWREHRVGSIRLTYPDRTIRVPRGFSVLEASLINDIPHAHVCGGRGRCSTCRIRVLTDLSALPAPSAAEHAVLERVHAAPGVRLACQLRPTSDIAFVPMLSPHATTVDAYRSGSSYSGVERYVVIMFVDMRGSSRLAEGRLPFDTVFVINQFLDAVSSAILAAGGEPNQILGDGLLALFGMGGKPEAACRQAIAACAAIAARVETLNSALAYALLEPIRFGIGIHAGVTIAGNIGYERHAQFTVIGDAVNVAARLEELTKPFGCEVMMSEEVYRPRRLRPRRPAGARSRRARPRSRAEGAERRQGGRSGWLPRRARSDGLVSGAARKAIPP